MSAAPCTVDRFFRTERTSSGVAPPLRALRVLVADDEPDVVEALRIVLRSEGCRMHAVPSAAALVQAVTEAEYDVALVDVRCAGQQASLDFLAQLHELDPTLPVIVMSAWGNVERAVEAVRRGAREYIQKPWDTARLVATLHREADVGAAQRRSRRLESETARLRALALPQLIARAPAMVPIVRLLELAASSSANVLITGERGTGKRVVARWIHAMSDRASQPFVAIDGARTSDVEIFGQARSGSDQPERLGCLELAHGGALFIDEIAHLSITQQAKLLATLKTGELRPVGSFRARAMDVQLLASSSVDLTAETQAGRVLAELTERVRAVDIRLPPLRERLEDVPLLAAHVVERLTAGAAHTPTFDEGATQALLEHAWPGNVRELELVVERALLASGGGDLSAAILGLGPPVASPTGDTLSLEDVERIAIRRALGRTRGNVVLAAKDLGLSRSAMYRRLQAYGIKTS